MEGAALIAFGFCLGVLVTVFFGKKVAAAAVADAKAVAYDAGRVVNDASAKFRATVGALEMRMHAKLDGLKAGAEKGIEKL